MKRPLLLGHRGSPRKHRENTLASFQAALSAGLDGVELDVRQAADGTLVVHHDAHLFDGRDIASTPYRKLRPHPVPTLAETLAWASDTGAYVNVEIKYEKLRPDERVQRTAELIKRYGLGGQVIVSSFNPLIVAAMRQIAPDVERALLFDRYPRWMLALATRLDVTAVHPHRSLVTRELMSAVRRRHWRVNVWTVNEPEEARRLLELDVDALIGDVPDVLLSAARGASELTAG